MITSELWRGKRLAVLGLARSGTATLNALIESGAIVTAWDGDAERLFTVKAHFGAENDPAASWIDFPHSRARLEFADPQMIDLVGFDGLIVSPGVPLNRHPITAKARAAGVPIIGDIELFAQARAGLPAHKVVGVTGTNGKSTTVSLIHHILQTAGVASRLGGNIGLPILEQEPLPAGGVYVLELSSYQIDLTRTLDCDVAVLLNITPDHLDRYDGFEAYAASKERLLEMQSEEHVIVFGSAYHGQRRSIYDRYVHTKPNVLCAPHYIMQDPADLWDPFDDRNWHSVQADWPSLQGPHNAENAGAAVNVCQALGLANAIIANGLETYRGLPHRMERVATRNGVAFVNDSKATNPESTAPALAAFDRVHWILGGQSKSDDLDACAPSFGHVVRAYTIGESGPRFAAILQGKVPVEESGTLANAVTSAAARATSGDTVLLSPACASFDQFRDFEDRGDQFRNAVEALA